MTTTVSLRKILDRKAWEMCSPAPVSATAGSHISSSRLFRQMQYYLTSTSTAYEYLPEEDAWSELPAAGLGGTFAAGAASICTPYSTGYQTSPTQVRACLQAQASASGTTTTVVTVNNYGVNALVNYQVRCVFGTSANLGQVRAVASNTATTITLAVAFSSATATGDVFALEPITSVVAGAASTTTVLTAISAVNNTAIGTVGNLVASSLITYQVRCTQTALASVANQGVTRWITANTTNSVTVGAAFPVAPSTGDVFVIEPYNTATATSAGTTTTVVTTNAWPINQFSGYQLRCLTGTAANIGKVALILSNTATTVTLQAALPAATAVSDTFVIEPIVFSQELTYTGTATTGGSVTTVPITGSPWVAGQWAASFQIRFVSGTNVGNIRQVLNNTASVLTLAQALPAVSDATSVFIIEPTIQYSQATSIATNQTLTRDLRGFKIRVTMDGIADERTILANTVGQNAVITVTSAFTQVPSANPSMTVQTAVANATGTTTTIITGNNWVANYLVGYQVRCLSGTAGNIGLTRTVVSNTATTLTLSVALPAATASSDTFELDYVQTPVITSATASANGTATSVVTTSSWAVSSLVGSQVRCVSGTPANIGKVRSVSSNNATTLTLSQPFPSATATADVFEILNLSGYTALASGAGSTTTVTTSNTWAANQWSGYQVRCIFGTAANLGCVRPVLSNTATTLTTVTAFPASTASDDQFVLEPVQHMLDASAWQLQSTRWWVFDAHTAAPVANQFRYYDYAYNAWFSTAGFSAAAIPGVPAIGGAWGNDGKMVATPSIVDTSYKVFYTSTATAATLWTLQCSPNTWAVNQWANYQVRIVSGTGAGQVRSIAGNTQNTLYVTTWLIAPDATSVFAIEGNDDNVYLLGNASVNTYKFSVSSGAWILLAPTVARAAAPNVGQSASWAWSTSEPTWADPSNIVSGRRIYSMRGGASAALDYYDIALNTWVSAITLSPGATTYTTGSKHELVAGRYLYSQKDITNRLYRTDFVKAETDPAGQFLFPQSTAIAGDTMFDVSYVDGGTTITWVYMLLNSASLMMRVMLI